MYIYRIIYHHICVCVHIDLLGLVSTYESIPKILWVESHSPESKRFFESFSPKTYLFFKVVACHVLLNISKIGP
jgi:hypothetical protein